MKVCSYRLPGHLPSTHSLCPPPSPTTERKILVMRENKINTKRRWDEMRHGEWEQALTTQADFFNAALSLPVTGVNKSQLSFKLHEIKSLSLEIQKKKKWIAFPSGAYYWMKGDVYKWKTTWQFSGNNLRIIIHSFHSLMIQYCRRKNYSSQGRSKSYDIHFYSSSHFIQQRAAAWNDRTKVLWNISKSRRNTRKSWTLFYASGCSPSSPWEWRPLGVQQSHQILKIHIAFKTKNKL